MAITSIKTGSSFTNLQKYNDFLGPNSAYIPSSFESIATATGTGSSGTITFSSIPSTYSSLQIRILGKNTATSTGRRSAVLQFNSDTANNYVAYHNLYGDGTSATADAATTYNGCLVSYMFASSGAGFTNMFGTAIIDIHDYATTTKNKTVRAFGGVNVNSATATEQAVTLHSSLWLSTAAINSISVKTDGSNWASGTVVSLYGIN